MVFFAICCNYLVYLMQKVCHVAAIYCTNKDEVKLSLSQDEKILK